MKVKTMLVYLDRCREVDLLTREQRGDLFTALMHYALDGEQPAFDDIALRVLFSVMQTQIDANNARYAERCETNRRIAAGRRRKAAQPDQTSPDVTNGDLTDTDTKTDTKTKTKTDTKTKTKTKTDTKTKTEPVTTNTQTKSGSVCLCAPTQPQIAQILADRGLHWPVEEITRFLAYNERTGWRCRPEIAVEKWEERRRQPLGRDAPMSQKEIDRMNDYLSLVNRFDT